MAGNNKIIVVRLNDQVERTTHCAKFNTASMGKWLSIKKEMEKDNVTQCGEREQERERDTHMVLTTPVIYYKH